jgi:Zn-dependent peptidase ImmA (M78 family)
MKIHVSGVTLESLRKRYKASLEGASHITGIDPATLKEWEREGAELSISEAKSLAKAYRTHWSIFLLETKVKPIKEPVNHRAGYGDNSPFSINTLHAYEVARNIIDASVEIDGQTVNPQLLDNNTRLIAHNHAVSYVRQIMDIDSEDILKVKGAPTEVYKFWRDRVSSLGIYVSEQEMPEEETKAFLLRDAKRAIIVVNKNDRYPFSKVFSLLHELGHMLRGEASAACQISEYASRTSTDEQWCNKFASEMMALDADVLADELVDTIRQTADPAEVVRRLATKYRTSFTVMLYKLKSYDKVSEKQCKEMLAFFERVILPKFKIKKDPTKEIKLGKSFYVNKDISRASASLSKEVVERQMHGSLSYSEAAKLLGTRASYLEDIKHSVGYGS